MGEHKYNPTAQKAKDGLLEPKKKGPSKREQERVAHSLLKAYLSAKTGIPWNWMGERL